MALKKGDKVDVTKRYFNYEGEAVLEDFKANNCIFQKWVNWSGMGHMVAEIESPVGTIHVPKHGMTPTQTVLDAIDQEREEAYHNGQHPIVKKAMDLDPEIVEHPLFSVFMLAISQVMYGKGERHGGKATPFLEQPWKKYGDLHGRGFLTGQAAKKLEEAASGKEGEAFIREVLGAMAYCGMAVIHEQQKGDNHE